METGDGPEGEMGMERLTFAQKVKGTLAEQIAQADDFASRALGNFNELDERGLGDTPKAQKLLARSQHWLDRSNKLRGCN